MYRAMAMIIIMITAAMATRASVESHGCSSVGGGGGGGGVVGSETSTVTSSLKA